MNYIKSIHTVIAGAMLAGFAGLGADASATVICYTDWPPGTSGSRLVNMCNSSVNGATAQVDNLGTGSGGNDKKLWVKFTLGASAAKVLALDSAGNAITGCEAVDNGPVDANWASDTCNATPAQIYVHAR